MHAEGVLPEALLPEIPDYDEDLDEAFVGPYNEYNEELDDETYDDSYEAETTAILEGRDPALDPQASASSGGAVSGDTRLSQN